MSTASNAPDDVAELEQQVGNAIVDIVGDRGWRRVDLVSRMTVPVQELVLTMFRDDGSTVAVAAPVELNRPLARLRVALYRVDPARGAWLSARFTIESSGTFFRSYNQDYEPDWNPPLADSDYVADLEMFPRELEYTPEWLLDKLPRWKDRPTPPDQDSTELAPLNPVQIGELVGGFRNHLRHRAPADWLQMFVDFRSVGSYVETRAQVITVFGNAVDWEPPEAAAFFTDLRRDMYTSGEGTWTSVELHIVVNGKYSAEYGWYDEPDWDHVPPGDAFRDELAMYPRAADRVPAWLSARADSTA
ncbi:hypothetical protein [Nocardia thraciensis]